ncbi:MAG: hypothetical protein KJ058_13720 [Thermoanaerobaculia bacterium]|nr:hypothetical protein [Thermoanaerobaculia bacterium]
MSGPMQALLADLQSHRRKAAEELDMRQREIAALDAAIAALESGAPPRRPAGRRPLSSKAPGRRLATAQREKAGVKRQQAPPRREPREKPGPTEVTATADAEARTFTGRLPKNVAILTYSGADAEKDAKTAAVRLIGRGYVRHTGRPLKAGQFDLLKSRRSGHCYCIFVERKTDDRVAAKELA